MELNLRKTLYTISLYKLTKKIDLAYPYKYNGIKMLLRGADFAPVIGEKFGESVSRRQL
jgi:hypothetical protein